MDDHKDTLDTLHPLTAVSVPDEWVAGLKNRVMAELDVRAATPSTEPEPIVSPYSVPSPFFVRMRLAASLLSILLLVTVVSVNEEFGAQTRYVGAQFALMRSHDAAQRSEVALTYLEQEAARHEAAPSMTTIHAVDRAARLARDELEGLKLMGEEGRYTQAECFELYENLEATTDNIALTIAASGTDASIDPEMREALRALLRTLGEVHTRAGERLGDYPTH